MNRTNGATSQQQLQVGAQTITYTLTFSNRKSVGITIRPDTSVNVRAPHATSLEAVAAIMHKRAPWILRHLQKFAQRPAKQTPASKPEGKSYQFLGHQLPLKIEPLADGKFACEHVKVDNNTVCVWVNNPKDKKRVKALLEKWSREQAELIFLRRMLMLFPHFKGLPVQLPELTIRRMKARWGSCSTNSVVRLNLKLIHLDESLIDYVIMHELCHLIEHNHSKHYYALLSRMMPDWSERRQRLNEQGMPE